MAPKGLPVVTKLEWSKPLGIVKYPDPRLRQVNAKVGVFDGSLIELAKEMAEIMYQDDGVGLAAPQVGVNIRMMIFNPRGREGRGQDTILVNPEIIVAAKPNATETEGCLSFPKIYADVERPRDVTVRAQNEKGETVHLQLGGENEEAAWISRIFQHEYDHLQGILFHDRMKPAILETVRAPLVEMEETFVAAQPGVKVQRVPAVKINKGFK